MLKVRNSEIAKFKRCQRSWYTGYYLEKKPAYGQRTFPAAFDTGNAVHAGLEAYYLGEDMKAALNAHKVEMMASLHPDADHKPWEKVWKMAAAMLDHYPAWVSYNGLDVGESTLAIEEQIEFPVAGVMITCRPDRLVRTRRGIVVEDWKTGVVDRPHMFDADWQMLNYGLAAWMKYGEIPFGARHRRIARSMHTTRAKKEQYAQHYVSFGPDRLEVHRKHLELAVTDLLAVRARLDAGEDPVYTCPPNRLSTCNWDCNVQEICSMMDQGEDWQYVLSTEFEDKEKH